MKKFIFTSFLLVLTSLTFAQAIQPVTRKIGKLTLSVDPRMEVLSSIQLISEYRPIQRNNPYSKELISHFSPYDTLEAVSLSSQFANHFSYDAPVVFMLHHSQPLKLKQEIPYSDYLIQRAGGEQNLLDYRAAIDDFIQKSNFKDFWKQHLPVYNQMLEKTMAECQDIDWIKALEEYYNETQNSYNIILSPAFIGGYGPRLKAKNGKWDIYACITTNTFDNNQIPYLNKEGLIYYLWHEFNHSFVNPEFDKYPERIRASKKLYTPLKKVMTEQAYSEWGTCVNEHVVRAVHLRLLDLHIGHEAYIQKLNYELARGFLYIEPILQKLKEFEELKKKTSITFSEFVPQLIDVLDSLANINAQKQLVLTFKGPINATFENHKIAVIYPTNIQDPVIKSDVLKYIRNIYKKFFNSPSNLLLSDSAALEKSLKDYSIVVYGSVSGNLFLNHFKSALPFSINNHELLADQPYTQSNLKIVSCQPNPQNKKLGMTIYSAFSDQDIIDINNVFHGPEDYVIFQDRNHILKRGNYSNKSTAKWIFTK